jgi:hypothetical protein
LVRAYPFFAEDPESLFCITTDASRWGIGAVLPIGSHPVAWLADQLHPEDLDRFDAKVGHSAFITTWEALEVLVAILAWRSL